VGIHIKLNYIYKIFMYIINMSSLPENVNYGNPNARPTNFPFYPNEKSNDIQEPTQDNSSKNSDSKSQNSSDKIMNFLNLKATTILTFAFAVAIGFGVKDFIYSIVNNFLQSNILQVLSYPSSWFK